jgi:hypothetical protein
MWEDEKHRSGNLEPRELVLVFSTDLPQAAVCLLLLKPPILSPVFGTRNSKAEAILNKICTDLGRVR